MGRMVSYPTPGGENVSGCLADVPAGAKSVAAIQSRDLYRYDAAHRFFNETRAEIHHAESAAESWKRTLAFAGAKL